MQFSNTFTFSGCAVITLFCSWFLEISTQQHKLLISGDYGPLFLYITALLDRQQPIMSKQKNYWIAIKRLHTWEELLTETNLSLSKDEFCKAQVIFLITLRILVGSRKKWHKPIYLITERLMVIVNTQRDILRSHLKQCTYRHLWASRRRCAPNLGCDPILISSQAGTMNLA